MSKCIGLAKKNAKSPASNYPISTAFICFSQYGVLDNREYSFLPQFAVVYKSPDSAARVSVSRNAFFRSRSEKQNRFFLFTQ